MKLLKYIQIVLLFGFIVGFSLNAECAKKKKLNVTVLDKETSAPIQKADVTVITLLNGSEIETDSKNTGKDGQCKFSLKIDQSYQYKVFTAKSGYIKGKKGLGKYSEIIISNPDDEDLILYLTLESQKSVIQHSKQAAEPITNDKVDNEVKKTGGSPAINEKEPLKPLKQDVIKEEQPATQVIDSTPQNKEYQNDSKRGKSFLWILIVIVCIVVFIWIMTSMYNKKCPKCRKWNAMVNVNREIVDEQQSTITKELKTKDAKGNVIKTEEKVIPATITKYRIHRKCRKCGYEDSYLTTEKKGN